MLNEIHKDLISITVSSFWCKRQLEEMIKRNIFEKKDLTTAEKMVQSLSEIEKTAGDRSKDIFEAIEGNHDIRNI